MLYYGYNLESIASAMADQIKAAGIKNNHLSENSEVEVLITGEAANWNDGRARLQCVIDINCPLYYVLKGFNDYN